MNIQEKPRELEANRCPACGSSQMAPLPDEKHASLAAKSEFDTSALSLLQSENVGLRRLVVELLEKNQQLREQLQATGRNAGIAGDLRLVSGRIAS
jgi:hypothetical protein